MLNGARVSFSKHAESRFKERYILDSDTIDIENILKGYTKFDFGKNSSFRKYLTSIECKHRGTICYIYRNMIFLIRGRSIVTTWSVPDRFKNVLYL